LVEFEIRISQGPIGEMLSVISTALQDSNSLPMYNIPINGVLCASIYRELDIKRYTTANLGTNRLGLRLLEMTVPRTQRELSNSLVRMKGPSRDNLTEINSDLKPKTALLENKLETKSIALSRIAFQAELKSRISQLQKEHQKYYNLVSLLYDPNFLVSCYLMIRSKPGNMSPGTTPETLDGIDLT
jgi:hypothetical protein